MDEGLKTCSHCKVGKPPNNENFSKNRRNPSGLNWYCRECDAEKQRKQYARCRALVDSFKDVPCMDCGKKYPPYVMQFDHVRGKKEFNIGTSVRHAAPRLLAEIAKCQVVCANCHAIRTHTRRVLSGEEE